MSIPGVGRTGRRTSKPADWKTGSKVLFVDRDGNGMSSTIVRNTPHEFMSFRHEGEIKDGQELAPDEKSSKWAGAMEEYTLRQTGDRTQLSLDMDVTDDLADYFQETFPKALERVKEIAEK